MLQLHKLTNKELEFYKKECNFTDDELAVYNMRAKGKSVVQISFAINCSERKVGNLIKSIKNKMGRV